MKYISVSEVAKKWKISERSVRNYCANNRVEGAFLTGKTWNIPETAEKPKRKNIKQRTPASLLDILKEEKKSNISGGIYHKIQIDMTYNSNLIEGSRLSHEQTRYIYETNTLGLDENIVNIDDIVETANHFRCIDIVIDRAKEKISENLIRELHLVLKNGTSDSRKEWFAVGAYKKMPNEVGGSETVLPEDVSAEMKKLITFYNKKEKIKFEDIVEFHYHLECIHPFQDGNGRIGRLIILKECLKHNIVPFIIEEELKLIYHRGLSRFNHERCYLIDTCLTSQDKFKKYLDYFRIKY